MIAALDIGGTKIGAGLVDRDGRVHATAQCRTHSGPGFEDGFERICALLREFGSDMEGIGVGCTGPVNPFDGTVGEAELLRGWWGAPLCARLTEEFGVGAVMENDADAVALAEWLWGGGRDAQCLVCISVGTGIGGGIVRGGELYRGAGGAHPEIGHTAIDVSGGPKCYCGLRGCWESLASGPAIERWYGGDLSAAEICRRARAGDAKAVDAVRRLGRYIGLGLVNVVTSYCPDVVLLSGGVMRDADLFIDDVRGMVRDLATQVPSQGVRIEVIREAEHAGLRGGAAAWICRRNA